MNSELFTKQKCMIIICSFIPIMLYLNVYKVCNIFKITNLEVIPKGHHFQQFNIQELSRVPKVNYISATSFTKVNIFDKTASTHTVITSTTIPTATATKTKTNTDVPNDTTKYHATTTELTAAGTTYPSTVSTISSHVVSKFSEVNKTAYLVHTADCVIPAMDPLSPMVQNYVKVKKTVSCPEKHQITYSEGHTIFVNKSVTSSFYKNNFTECQYTPFEKKNDSDTQNEFFKEMRKIFTLKIDIGHKFVKVDCFGKNKVVIETSIYSFFFRNVTRESDLKSMFSKLKLKRPPPNVVMFIFESTSRMNFIRQMNESLDYMRNTIKTVEIQGYNKIGLNTFPNIVGDLLGMSLAEANISNDKWLDKHHFIWKNFTAAEYRSFYIEDGTGFGTFNYLKRGFRDPPIDGYMRPYMIEIERLFRKVDECERIVKQTEIMQSKLIEFMQTFTNEPKFAIHFIGELTHDAPNPLGLVDLSFKRTLTTLNENGHFENSVVFIMGDHGSRYGSIRNTYQGRLEEQLPALFISLPEWLIKERPDLFKNLNTNSHQLTNNFDIFSTLIDIIDIGKGFNEPKQKTKYGVSLLRKIPTNRTCDSIQIPPNFCTCASYTSVNISSERVYNISSWIVKSINDLLKDVQDVCVTLKLSKILDARKSKVSPTFIGEKEKHVSDYVLFLMVSPSNATFEANVRFNAATAMSELLAPVSRTNKYGNQANCIQHRPGRVTKERYCYCKSFIV